MQLDTHALSYGGQILDTIDLDIGLSIARDCDLLK
jgi:hypothetical protein